MLKIWNLLLGGGAVPSASPFESSGSAPHLVKIAATSRIREHGTRKRWCVNKIWRLSCKSQSLRLACSCFAAEGWLLNSFMLFLLESGVNPIHSRNTLPNLSAIRAISLTILPGLKWLRRWLISLSSVCESIFCTFCGRGLISISLTELSAPNFTWLQFNSTFYDKMSDSFESDSIYLWIISESESQFTMTLHFDKSSAHRLKPVGPGPS